MQINSFLFLVLIIAFFMNSAPTTFQIKPKSKQNKLNQIKKDAFLVLDKKCNYCHQKKKRLNVFTLENMDVFAPQIKQAVFVTKRMPKGRIKLTSLELKILKSWLSME